MKRNILFFALVCALLLLLNTRSVSAHARPPTNLRAAPIAAAPPVQASPNCEERGVPGYKLTVLTQNSRLGADTVICNYSVEPDDGKSTSGLAITIDYGCPDATASAWQSKTGARPKWDPKAKPPVLEGEVNRDANFLHLREDREVSGYTGSYSVQEKVFYRFDAQTLGTVVALTDIKPAKDAKTPLDPNVLNFSAVSAQELAGALASAHVELKYQLKCAEPVPSAADELELDVDLSLVDYKKPPALQVLSANDSIRFGDEITVLIRVNAVRKQDPQVVGSPAMDPQVVGPSPVNPAMVRVSFDGVPVTSDVTNDAGLLKVPLPMPETIPNGRTQHTLVANVSKDPFTPAQDAQIFEIQRGLGKIIIALDADRREHLVGEDFVLSGRVWSQAFGLWNDPVQAQLEIYDSDLRAFFGGNTDDSGFFKVKIPLAGSSASATDFVKLFVIQAHPVKKETFEDGGLVFQVRVRVKGTLLVTATTDKGVYFPDDELRVAGTVSSEGKAVNGTALILLDGAVLGSATVYDGRFGYLIAPTTALSLGNHVVTVKAQVPGLNQGQDAIANFIVQSKDERCPAGDISIAGVQGNPIAGPPATSSSFMTNQPLVPNGHITQGFRLITRGSDRVALVVDFGGGAVGSIGIGADTDVTIIRACRDESGKLHITLRMDPKGKLLVNVDHPTGTDVSLQIVSPVTQIKSKTTKYFVSANDDGTTTVVALQGIVLVSDPNGENTIELPAVNQITIHPGEKPNPADIQPISGVVDPTLEPLFGGAPTLQNVPQPNTGAANMTLQAAQRYAFANEIVLVPVWLIKANNVANLNFELQYDAAVIRPEGDILKGNLLDNALFKTNPKTSGFILVGVAQTRGIQSEVGTLVEIPFRVIGKPGDVSPLLLNVTTINDPNGGVLEVDRIAGEIVIVNDDGTLPPITGGGGGTGGGAGGSGGTGGGAGGIAQGDCDGSGMVNELDALCALEMSVGIRTARDVVDIDGGGVTSRDAVIILQRAVGQ